MGRESRARVAAKFNPAPRRVDRIVRCLECGLRTSETEANLRRFNEGRCKCGGELKADTARTAAEIARYAEFKKLAKQIRDRDHLAEIIATVQPHMRAAVERELLKHVTFLV